MKKNFLIQKNEITGEIQIKRKSENEFNSINISDLYLELSSNGIKTSIRDIEIYLSSSKIAIVNPFREYFEKIQDLYSAEEHGDCISEFSKYITVCDDKQDFWEVQLKKWLVRTVKCGLENNFFNKNAIILVSEKQNTGKSTFTRFLVPNELADYVVENITIDKDSLISLTENLIGILDEMASLSKVEITALKSILSKKEVKIRAPYERKAEMKPRRISFIGSTNRRDFLTDETGNVRWLCFEIEGINWDYATKIDIDIIWSQAYFLHQNNFKCELTAEEIAENEISSKNFRRITAEQELIQKYFSPSTKEEGEFMTPTEITNFLNLEVSQNLKTNVSNIGKALKILGYQNEQKRCHNGDFNPVRGYYVTKNKT
ncbi:MAG: virulence-associated E family protein [Sphingobacteriaceae bacterium]|nr:virulence-associated E family protein [Sphingobacteriaceae bacterium]